MLQAHAKLQVNAWTCTKNHITACSSGEGKCSGLPTWHVIQCSCVLAHVGELVDEVAVAFEVDHVDDIEAYEGLKETDVSLCQPVSGYELLLAEDALGTIKCSKQVSAGQRAYAVSSRLRMHNVW